jgi:sugar phosphate isomerase/epimerase
MKRRALLRRAGAAAAAVALGDSLGAGAARAAECKVLPGVQLFTLRDALAEDPRAAFARLAKIGIVEAELFGLDGDVDAPIFGLRPAELARLLADGGIRVPSSQIDGALANLPRVAERANALGISTLVSSIPPELNGTRDGRAGRVPPESRAQLDAIGDRLNRGGRELRGHGIALAYHNHEAEFVRVDGVLPYDYLMSRTDPELVKIELDVGWLAVAGQDPASYVRRYAARTIACHLKDYDPSLPGDVPDRKLVEPGAGRVDFGSVLAAMQLAGIAHGFIEIDYAADPFGAVERGVRHLRDLGGC